MICSNKDIFMIKYYDRLIYMIILLAQKHFNDIIHDLFYLKFLERKLCHPSYPTQEINLYSCT